MTEVTPDTPKINLKYQIREGRFPVTIIDNHTEITYDIYEACDLLNKRYYYTKHLIDKNYELEEKYHKTLENLDQLERAIEMVQREYRLKVGINDIGIRMDALCKLNCITEIKKQLELIRLSERGDAV